MSIQRKTFCSQHECDDCGKKLYSSAWGASIFMCVIWVVMFGMMMLLDHAENKRVAKEMHTIDCYEYAHVGFADKETLKGEVIEIRGVKAVDCETYLPKND